MLILARKPGQKVAIGDDIELTIVSIYGSEVRIGIDAPRDIEIVRDDAKTDADGNVREVNGNR